MTRAGSQIGGPSPPSNLALGNDTAALAQSLKRNEPVLVIQTGSRVPMP